MRRDRCADVKSRACDRIYNPFIRTNAVDIISSKTYNVIPLRSVALSSLHAFTKLLHRNFIEQYLSYELLIAYNTA